MANTKTSPAHRKTAVKPVAPNKLAAGKPASKTAVTAPAKAPAKSSARKPASPSSRVSAARPAPATVSIAEKLHVAVVRDSFTMTASEETLLKQCKRDAIALGRETRKSEVLRAAIRHFVKLSAADRNAAYAALEPIKTGRPKKAKR